MTDKVYMLIKNPKWTKALINSKRAQLKDLELTLLPGAVRYDSTKVKSSAINDTALKYVEKVKKLECEIAKLEEKYLVEQEKLVSSIERIKDPDEQDVLIARYITGEKIEDIAKRKYISDSTVYRLQRVGIRHLEEIVGGKKLTVYDR